MDIYLKDYINSVNSRKFISDLFYVILTIKTSEVALYKKSEMSQSVSLSVSTYIHFEYQLQYIYIGMKTANHIF